MALLMLIAACYGVLQLAVIGWPTRTVRVSTLFLAVGVGLYGCSVIALALQYVYTRTLASATGQPLFDVVSRASYTVDPVIEELVKVLPLLLIVVLARRRQWSFTDFVVGGAAIGSGFALMEGLLRYGQNGARAIVDPAGGWDAAVGLGGASHVPGLGEVLSHWVPAPVYNMDFLSFGPPDSYDQHLVYTAVAGFGVALLVLGRRLTRLLGLVPLAFSCAIHAAYNYVAANPQAGAWTHSLANAHTVFWLYPLIALALAMAKDLTVLRRAKRDHPELLLTGERGGGPAALAEVAMIRPRWTVPITLRFLLSRRSLLYCLARGGPVPEVLRAGVLEARQRLDAAHDRAAWAAAARSVPSMGRRIGRVSRSWQLWVWIVLTLPALLYLALGTFPVLSGLQKLFTQPAAFRVLVAATALGLVWLGWQLVQAVSGLPALRRRQYGEPLARAQMSIWSGAGSIAAGAVGLLLWLHGSGPTDRLINNGHILDALSNALIVLGLALMLFSFFMFPPFGLAALAGGGLTLVLTEAAGAFAISEGLGAVLAGLGIVLSQASGGTGGSGGDSGGGNQPNPDDEDPKRQARLNELAKDPAHGGRITPGSMDEADAALGLEERGELTNVRRDPTGGADFLSGPGQGTPWDVKSFNSNFPPNQGGFTLQSSLDKIAESLRDGENVILRTQNLSGPDLAQLKAAVQVNPDWVGKVLWWP
jgi:RsiW-degrading membrane proteinase PrsW (M82 family)